MFSIIKIIKSALYLLVLVNYVPSTPILMIAGHRLSKGQLVYFEGLGAFVALRTIEQVLKFVINFFGAIVELRNDINFRTRMMIRKYIPI